MPIGDAAEHLGRFVGRIAVEAALGKGVGLAFKALSASKYGAQLLQEVVKISKGVKETVGKIPIPTNASVKVVVDTLGNKMIFPDVEFTKLSDLVSLMKSSDEGLTMLKKGSTAGTKAIKEVAESGLSEVSQTGLKALRQSLSKESLSKAKEQLITLNIAKTEVVARLDDLSATAKLSQRAQANVRAARNSLIRNLTQDDLVGALRDIYGKPVKQSGSGRIWNHRQEVQQGLNSLEAARDSLITEMRSYQPNSNEFKKVSKEADAIAEMIHRVNKFLEIK